MNSQPLPSKAAGHPSASARSAETVRRVTILRLENEASIPQLLSNPQRLPIDAQDREDVAPGTMETLIKAYAGASPKDLARAKVILLGARIDTPSIGVGWLTARARRNGPDLPLADLRGNIDASEACEADDETLCPALAAAIEDPEVAGVLVDDPSLTIVWIALLKPYAIATLSADARFCLELGHRQYAHEVLFPERGAAAWVRRFSRRLLSWSSALPKVLAGLGGLVLLSHKLGIL